MQLGLTAAGTAQVLNLIPFLIPFTKNELLNLNSDAKLITFFNILSDFMNRFYFPESQYALNGSRAMT